MVPRATKEDIAKAETAGWQAYCAGTIVDRFSPKRSVQKAFEKGWWNAERADCAPIEKFGTPLPLQPETFVNYLVMMGADQGLAESFVGTIDFEKLKPGVPFEFDLDDQVFFNLYNPVVAVMRGVNNYSHIYWIVNSSVVNESLIEDGREGTDSSFVSACNGGSIKAPLREESHLADARQDGKDDYVKAIFRNPYAGDIWIEQDPRLESSWEDGWDEGFQEDIAPLADYAPGKVIPHDNDLGEPSFEDYMKVKGADPDMLDAFLESIDTLPVHGIVKPLDPDDQAFYNLPAPVLGVMRGVNTDRVFWLIAT